MKEYSVRICEGFCTNTCRFSFFSRRSSSGEFQQRLAAEYHCILKMKLKHNWLHVRDSLSVWKRSETCCMAFENDDGDDDDDDDEDEAYYKHIPPEEVLPVDAAAPCVAHLLQSDDTDIRETYTDAGDRNGDSYPSPDCEEMTDKKGDNAKEKAVYEKT